MGALAVSPRRRATAVVDHPAPELQAPTEVLAKVLEVGVCGTDREIARFEYATAPDAEDYLVLGHESLAEVVEVGDGVEGLTPGDLVVTMVRRSCAHGGCLPCRAGRQDFCVTGDYTERGIKGRHGFMTEQLVVDARFMVPLPAEFRTVGVLTEPLTIAQKALDELWRAQDRLPWTEPGANGDGRGRGHRAVVLRALRILGPNGVLVLTGGPGPEPSRSVDVSALVRQMVLGNQLVLGTVNAGRRANESAVQSLAAFHRRWPSELQALITGRHPLDEVPELLTARSSGIKDIVVLEDAP